MFQTFDVKSDPSTGPARLAALRNKMTDLGVDALLVPHGDEHQNEYLPPRAERLAWLTGFTGSAGACLVLADKAVVFVDGRYTLQARDQTDAGAFEIGDLISQGPVKWLEANARKRMKVAFDPWLHSAAAATNLKRAAEAVGFELVALDDNPLDAIWTDQPALPAEPVRIQRKELAGTTAKSKLRDIQKAVRAQKADAVIATDPTSICWLFNIRGNDVTHTPLVLSWAIIPARGMAQLFLDEAKLGIEENAYLTQLADLHPYADFADAIDALAKRAKIVMVDPNQCAEAITKKLEVGGVELLKEQDPCALPRACKNRVELKGATEAHKRDGAAMVTFLAWLDAQDADTLDEISVAKKLEACRAETGKRLDVPLRDLSFDTICGSGPNGAIVHYRVTEATNRRMNSGELLLMDSGAQYDDGTTDITRVIPLGKPNDEYRRHFTLVLKGMIAISEVRFPEGTRGVDLDGLARRALWAEGLDYGHGTGHGIGSYLAVHEGPQNISKRGMASFQTGMIVSNEPGYYRTGSHGIRIENLVYVKPSKVPKNGGEIPVHAFETLTLCPIDRRLVDRKLLSKQERRWLNRYHAKVRRTLTPLLEDADTIAWLEQATNRI
ncbi:MAG: aminopeptidase P family protein [Pseudomonadota bacterium]